MSNGANPPREFELTPGERSRRFLATVGAMWSGQTLSILENLAVVPLYLWYWSANRYGEWLALSALVAYLGTLDLGINMAGGNRLTQAYALGNREAFRRCQSAAMVFYVAIAVLGTAGLAIAVRVFPVGRWAGLKLTSSGEAATVVFLLGAQVLWGMPAGFIAGTYRAMGNMSRTAWIENLQSIAALSLGALCLVLHGGMIALASVQLACLAAVTFGVICHLRRYYPDVLPGFRGADMSLIRELIRPSASFGLVMLSEAIRLQAIVLLISRRLGPAAVALFVSSRTLSNLVRQVAGTLKNALWPHVTALEAQRRYSAVRQFHRFWVAGSTALCLSIGAALWFEGASVIEVWTRGRLIPDPVLLQLLIAQTILQAPWMASGLITIASSKHGRLSQAYFWSSILGVAAAAGLMGYFGLRAVPIGTIAGEALICYHFVTHDTCSRIGEPYWPFALRQWLFVGGASALTLLAGWEAHRLAVGPAPMRWGEVGLATMAASLGVTWLFGIRPGERSEAKAWLRLVRT